MTLLPLIAALAFQSPGYRLDWEVHRKMTGPHLAKPYTITARREVHSQTKAIRMTFLRGAIKEVLVLKNGEYGYQQIEAGQAVRESKLTRARAQQIIDLYTGSTSGHDKAKIHATERKSVAGVLCRKERIDSVYDGKRYRVDLWSPVDVALRSKVSWLERASYDYSHGAYKLSSREVTTRVVWGS